MICAARRRRARERDLVDAGMLDEVRADRRPRAGDDVDHAGREADLGRELREPQRGQRRRGVGLEHDRAAGGERRRELPRRHRQRVVPRHDLPGDADRLLQGVEEERAADRVRAAGDRRDPGGVEAEVLDAPGGAPPSRTRSPCRRCATRARRGSCGRRRSRRRARAGGASARSAASSASRPSRAPRAASTARSTSSVVATAVRASVSPVAGSISSRVSALSTNSPPIQRP